MQLLTVQIQYEHDVVLARQRARQIAGLLRFDPQDQARIATAVSEIVRNAFKYAGQGRIDFLLEGKTSPQVFVMNVIDRGRGISNLSEILDGQYRSRTGMGLGIIGSQRLMDQFDIHSSSAGTTVSLKKLLPRSAPIVTPAHMANLSAELARMSSQTTYDEVQQQNQELIRTMEELRERQEELTRLNQELEDTNRGVLALYAELDEKADHLRRADELKSKFLSNMSHEFRTPLNSTIALCRILLDRLDGPLTPEQEKQINYIQKGSNELLVLVNDLLDLAKIEAGKTVISPNEFDVRDLFSALRGMLRPLLVSQSVALHFDEPAGIPMMHTDEGKVSQILRNFISNALKFTEHGEVRVSATLLEDGRSVRFSVADTGIGISPADLVNIFKEFNQVEHRLQKRVKGTGLGLPLSKRLAELMGGTITVKSHEGKGSTFIATIPVQYQVQQQHVVPAKTPAEAKLVLMPGKIPVIIVEDTPDTAFIYRKFIEHSEFQCFIASTVPEARRLIRQITPAAIVLDIMLPGEDAWTFLTELKSKLLPSVPVLVATSVEDQQKGLSLGADEYIIKPLNPDKLLEFFRHHLSKGTTRRALIVDDDEGFRYAFRNRLQSRNIEVLEAENGIDAVGIATRERLDIISVDMVMPGIDGLETIRRLREVLGVSSAKLYAFSSKVLAPQEIEALRSYNAAFLSKSEALENVVTTILYEDASSLPQSKTLPCRQKVE
ncbi:MAG TPA: ATP-binding protein [Planctomycetota bacterium]|nr:ATP-binding protein [Planctomycetota bacterium]